MVRAATVFDGERGDMDRGAHGNLPAAGLGPKRRISGRLRSLAKLWAVRRTRCAGPGDVAGLERRISRGGWNARDLDGRGNRRCGAVYVPILGLQRLRVDAGPWLEQY